MPIRNFEDLQREALRRAAGMQTGQGVAAQQPMSAGAKRFPPRGRPLPGLGTEDYLATPTRPAAPASAQPQPDAIQRKAGPSGFVTFGQQLAANQGTAQRMLRQLSTRVEDAGDPSKLLQTEEGRQAMLQKAYGGATSLDAALAGAAAPADYFSRLEAQYGAEAQRRAAEAARAESERLRLETQRTAEAQRRAAEDAATAAADREAETKSAQRARVAAIGERPSDSAWAAYHGMTLKEWNDNGRNPPLPY